MANPPDEDALKLIGSRLKEAREELGLSRKQAGKQLGVSECMVGHMERGVRRLTPQKAGALEDLLGVDRAFVWPELYRQDCNV